MTVITVTTLFVLAVFTIVYYSESEPTLVRAYSRPIIAGLHASNRWPRAKLWNCFS
jgi:hypothetical protein